MLPRIGCFEEAKVKMTRSGKITLILCYFSARGFLLNGNRRHYDSLMTGRGSLKDSVQLLATGGPQHSQNSARDHNMLFFFLLLVFFFLNRASKKHSESCEPQHLQRRTCPESRIASLCKTHSHPCRQIRSHKSAGTFLLNGQGCMFQLWVCGWRLAVH